MRQVPRAWKRHEAARPHPGEARIQLPAAFVRTALAHHSRDSDD